MQVIDIARLSQKDIRELESKVVAEIKEDSNLLLVRIHGVFANFRIEKFPEVLEDES